jgi:hypothetical protein
MNNKDLIRGLLVDLYILSRPLPKVKLPKDSRAYENFNKICARLLDVEILANDIALELADE